ncbi:MAG: tripartite tricarboxylate transporter substrate binding protein [Betaproteobacteria bacterium]|jgi:tripartite-type tricarboxylate transporter receptor subunit TctC
MFKMRVLIHTVFGFLVFLTTHISFAEDYPNKPIRIIVGPGTDALARILSEKISEDWGNPVIVDVRPAAGGIVAGDAVAKAAPDGYTLLLSSSAYTINSVLQPKLPFDFVKDLKPVSLIATIPIVLVVNNELAAQNVKDLVSLAKSKPGALNYGSSGNGTPAHLTAEMFNQATNVSIVHVPYKGIAPSVTDTIGGQVQLMFSVAPSVLPMIRGNKLRAIAVTSTKRYKLLPDVPTVMEQGYPDVVYGGWNGIHVPAKTPPEIVQKLNAEITKILSLPEVQAKVEAAGFESFIGTTSDFESFESNEIIRLKKLVKSANIKID